MKGLAIAILCTLVGLGNARPQTTIIGGRPAEQGEIPYMLSQQINGQHSCGASIITVQNLTLAVCATHCTNFIDAKKDNISVVAGELQLSRSSGLEQRVKVTEILNHPNYTATVKRADISLLFLEEQINFNDNVRPIVLPSPGNIESGSIQISGWGVTEHGLPSDDLLTVDVPVVTDQVCMDAYKFEKLTPDFLCAGKMGEGGADSCQMDSGGPAVQDGKLVGVVSFGMGCGLPDYPGVYTEVSYFLDWINDSVAEYISRNKIH